MVERNLQDTSATENTQDTALTVSSPKALAVTGNGTDFETTALLLSGINSVANLTYQVNGGYFFLTSTPVDELESIPMIGNEDEKASLADLAAALGINLEPEAKKRTATKVLSHSQWLTLFRADVDELPEHLQGVSKLRCIGRYDAFLQAIKAVKFDCQTKGEGDELSRVAKFLTDTANRASEGIKQQPKFAF